VPGLPQAPAIADCEGPGNVPTGLAVETETSTEGKGVMKGLAYGGPSVRAASSTLGTQCRAISFRMIAASPFPRDIVR
jgi:hypothetical protein